MKNWKQQDLDRPDQANRNPWESSIPCSAFIAKKTHMLFQCYELFNKLKLCCAFNTVSHMYFSSHLATVWVSDIEILTSWYSVTSPIVGLFVVLEALTLLPLCFLCLAAGTSGWSLFEKPKLCPSPILNIGKTNTYVWKVNILMGVRSWLDKWHLKVRNDSLIKL